MIINLKVNTFFNNSEKNRLVIQPIGIQVIEFLFENYSHLFEYEYTREMEDKLDNILLGDDSLENVCEECYQNIKHIYYEEHLMLLLEFSLYIYNVLKKMYNI